jgi:Methylamine utilisation protein MauE
MIMVLVGAAIIQLGLGLLFIAAGISKLLRTRSVYNTVEGYRLLPSGGVKVVAWLLGPIAHGIRNEIKTSKLRSRK